MDQNEVRSSKCSEGNDPHRLTDRESKIYSGSALSSLQISQQDPVSLKRDHTGTGPTVKAPYLNKVRPFQFYSELSIISSYFSYENIFYLHYIIHNHIVLCKLPRTYICSYLLSF